MKKRRKVARHLDEDVQTQEAAVEPDLIVMPLFAPSVGGMLGGQAPIRDVGSAGVAAIRGCLTTASGYRSDTTYVVGALPPKAVVIGGGVWVNEAFGGGGTLQLG